MLRKKLPIKSKRKKKKRTPISQVGREIGPFLARSSGEFDPHKASIDEPPDNGRRRQDFILMYSPTGR